MNEFEDLHIRRAHDHIEREKLQLHLIEEMHRDTPRFRRARRFAHLVQAMMRDFLPNDRDCRRRIEDYLLEIGFEGNLEIINVPPECDEFDRLALSRRMLEASIARVGVVIAPDLTGKPT